MAPGRKSRISPNEKDKKRVSSLALAGADAGNYTLVQPDYLTADISPRTLIVAATATSRPYDGTTAVTVTLSDDRLEGDELTVSYVSAAFSDSGVASGKTVTVTEVTLSGSAPGNYALAETTVTTTADITPGELTVTAGGDAVRINVPVPFFCLSDVRARMLALRRFPA